MPIIVSYVNGQRDIVDGENWRQLDQATARLGEVILTDKEDGHKITAVKSNVVKTDEFTKEAWEEKLKKAQEVRAKQLADELVTAEAQAKRTANEVWARKPWPVRLFIRKPFPEVV